MCEGVVTLQNEHLIGSDASYAPFKHVFGCPLLYRVQWPKEHTFSRPLMVAPCCS